MSRTATEVINDHLHRRIKGDVEGDIRTNFSKDIVILSHYGTFRGHEGVRQSAAQLDSDAPKSDFDYKLVKIEDNYGLLEWTASSPAGVICDGVDSFVVEDGKIIMQSIYYKVLGS